MYVYVFIDDAIVIPMAFVFFVFSPILSVVGDVSSTIGLAVDYIDVAC